ncbi:MAG: HAD family hydrolase [Nitrososphaerales archaeon]
MLSFDLDGTLIKKGFDDIFWNHQIPKIFAERRKITFEEAQKFVIKEYDKVGPSDTRWYIPEYWFDLFDLGASLQDILHEVNSAAGVYDDVGILQNFARSYQIIISTNNPRTILEQKLSILNDVRQSISYTFSSVSDFNNIVKNREFYLQVCSRLRIKPEHMLHVGDDRKYDLEEPSSIGVNAVLIDRQQTTSTQVIHTLEDLKQLLTNC